MRILVTGAAGFIGAHTILALRDRHEVVGVDAFDDAYSVAIKRARVASMLAPSGIDLIEGDLSDPEFTRELLAPGFDLVIHLAARPGVRGSVADLPKYVACNITAFANVLAVADSGDVGRILYASSSSVYGSRDGLLSETLTGLRPESYYGATKLSDELIADAVARRIATPLLGLRFFTVYGPWGRPDMLVWRLVHSALTGSEVTIFGDGSRARDFTFVDDVVSAIVALAEDPDSRAGHSVLNIGGGRPCTVLEVLDLVTAACGQAPRVSFGDSVTGDVSRTSADSRLLELRIGSAPGTTLNEGLAQVARWMTAAIQSGSLPDG